MYREVDSSSISTVLSKYRYTVHAIIREDDINGNPVAIVNVEDNAGNMKRLVVTAYDKIVDTISPTLVNMTIHSNNTNTTSAKSGDKITIVLHVSEPITASALILNRDANVTVSDKQQILKRLLDSDLMHALDSCIILNPFSIKSDFNIYNGNRIAVNVIFSYNGMNSISVFAKNSRNRARINLRTMTL